MPPTHSPFKLDSDAFDSALLRGLSDVAEKSLGLGFIVVYPSPAGWDQSPPAGDPASPGFCRLVQTSPDGSKHCRMCHILMAVAASTQGTVQQKCHTGVSAFVAPVSLPEGNTVAVISDCVATNPNREHDWRKAQARGKELGLDLRRLKKAFGEMKVLGPAEVELLRSIIAAAAEAIKEIATRRILEEKLHQRLDGPQARAGVKQMLERALKHPIVERGALRARTAGGNKGKGSALVEVVAGVVSRNPGMAFAVSDIAAAARMTPNHFSTLFRQGKGESFLQYLTNRRIDLARELLRDLTLNIGEVAARCGYADPGYFARIFKQETGVTPRVWRNCVDPSGATRSCKGDDSA